MHGTARNPLRTEVRRQSLGEYMTEELTQIQNKLINEKPVPEFAIFFKKEERKTEQGCIALFRGQVSVESKVKMV